jgi:hypothetical protein
MKVRNDRRPSSRSAERMALHHPAHPERAGPGHRAVAAPLGRGQRGGARRLRRRQDRREGPLLAVRGQGGRAGGPPYYNRVIIYGESL